MFDPAAIEECPCANGQDCWEHGIDVTEVPPPMIPVPTEEWELAPEVVTL